MVELRNALALVKYSVLPLPWVVSSTPSGIAKRLFEIRVLGIGFPGSVPEASCRRPFCGLAAFDDEPRAHGRPDGPLLLFAP